MRERLKKCIRGLVIRAAGIQHVQEEIDTLFYFLNSYHDITTFPKADGDLRKIQICDAILMEIIDEICKKNNLRYWISCGNLIGALRHKGSIPWDDDTDIYMCRNDYERAKEVFDSELLKYGFTVEEPKIMGWIGIGYKTADTGVWLDIFPVDFFSIPSPEENNIIVLYSKLKKYHKKYLRIKNRVERDKIQIVKRKIVPFLVDEKEATHCCRAVEFEEDCVIQSVSTLFPLRPIQYEHTTLMGPSQPERYINDWLKGDYREFPRGGILHHGGKKGAIYEWASRSGTNLDQVKEYLTKVLIEIRSNALN